MSTYALVLFVSLVGPLIFSFHKKTNFLSQWWRVIISSVVVAVPFWIWDGVATARGDWGFDTSYVWRLRIVGMPIEEILFFIIIPFCCLFIYHVLEKYKKTGKIRGCNNLDLFVGVVLVVTAIILREKFYTTTILWWAVITILAVRGLHKDLWQETNYWIWIGITFIPFILINGILTYLPIVWYSNQAILGIRFVSIPIEDFLYSWSLLTLNLVAYKKIGVVKSVFLIK